MHKIETFKVLSDYNIWLKYVDGTEGSVNLSYLAGKGVFAVWNDYEIFKKLSIGSSGELTWESGVDLCPDALYLKLTHKRPEEIFPNLKREAVNA